jgi:hypothetical protein
MQRYPEALVQAASAGDRDAIAALLRRRSPTSGAMHGGPVARPATLKTPFRKPCLSFTAGWARCAAFGSLSAWLFVIVHRACLSLAATIVGVPLDLDAVDREVETHKIPVDELRLDLAKAI